MKTPVATSNPGQTQILTKQNYMPSTIEPANENHCADLHTQYCRKQDTFYRKKRIGIKY